MNMICNIKKFFFAVDLGAISGRIIFGSLLNDSLSLKELSRFPIKYLTLQEKYYWDIYYLFEEIKKGLIKVSRQGIQIESVGIDAWGVDFIYIAKDGTLLNLPRSYREPYTNGITTEYFSHVSRKKVYELTGIQIMNFNSLFQLYAARKESSSALESAESILFIPDVLNYLLSGEKICEYTIASTSQLLNPFTGKFEPELLSPIDIKPTVFPKIVMSGTVIGYLSKCIQRECDISNEITIIAVAEHDTASAVVAVPAGNENFAFLSSGTSSLMGIETKNPINTEESYLMNFTNEGGAENTVRFLKNITGMWILKQCRKEWEKFGKIYTYSEIANLPDSVENFQFYIDPDDDCFINPESMINSIKNYCIHKEKKCQNLLLN